MTAENPIIEKLRKLRRKAEDPSVSEAEAALYAEKVAQLLAEHGLSMSHLEESQRTDHVETQKFEMMYSDPWRTSLFRSIEQLYFCYSFRENHWDPVRKEYRTGRTIVGRPHNVVMLRETYEYLEAVTLRLAKQYVRTEDVENDVRLGGTTTRAARIGFERGCGERLAERMRARYREQAQPDAPQIASGSNLPALYKTELSLVREYTKQQFPGLTMKKRPGSSINDHGQAGKRAADGVSLSAQISGTKTRRTQLR